MLINKGDIVVRKSYKKDIVFRVEQILDDQQGKQLALLKGVNMRLVADAPVDDLMLYEKITLEEQLKKILDKENSFLRSHILKRGGNKRNFRSSSKNDFFDVPGHVLHIDGDETYLQKCIDAYTKLNIPVHGYWIPEKDMPEKIVDYILQHHPDIIVITGHDGLLKDKNDFTQIENYRNSRYFVDAVKATRKICPNLDETVIFAGACQSHYEALIAAGANFASSPKRVMIHAFDPVFIVEKIAYTSFKENPSITDIISGSITGAEGIGGVETRGKFRLGYPKSPY